MFEKLWWCICLISLGLSSGGYAIGYAQDDDPPAFEISLWLVEELDENGEPLVNDDPEAPPLLPIYVLLVSFADDPTLIIVWQGVDIVYTPNEDGTYTGSELVGGAYEFVATLTRDDETTMLSHSTLTAGSFVSEKTLRYTLINSEETEVVYQVYSESERTIEEYSQFQECLGRTDGSPGNVWVRPDLLTFVEFYEDGTILRWNKTDYNLIGGVFTAEQTLPFGTFDNEVTETFEVTADYSLAYNYHAIAGGRDDCEMIYHSTFVPFDGDFATIFDRAEALQTE